MRPTRLLAILISMMLFALPIAAQDVMEADIVQAPPDGIFTPIVRMLGMQTDEGFIEWVVTISNTGSAAGDNVVLTDLLVNALRVETVQINTGTASINGQTVTVIIPTLAAGETVQFSIITTPLADAVITNTICATADNYVGEECTFALPIQALPATGETPQWRGQLQWLSLIIVSVSLILIGGGLLGWRIVHE